MKKVYALLFSLTCLSASLFGFNKDGRILMTARLTGAQEVPVVVTKAKGLVTVVLEEDRSLTINGVLDSLSGNVSACHFHRGIFGANGGVVLDLFQYVKGKRLYGKIPAATVTKALLVQLMSDSIYINVHTAANPGGEIRGQVYLQTEYPLWTIMAGAFEVPAVNTRGVGLASISLSRSLTQLKYKMVVSGLSGAITGAHLHRGANNGTGPVSYNLTANGNVLEGTIKSLTQGFIDSLANGLVYVNIHTAANPNGEIRGQLGFVDGPFGFDCLLDGSKEVPAVTSNAKGLALGWVNESLDTMTYAVFYTGLTTTAAHFHTGGKDRTGGVIVNLEAYTIAPTAAYSAKIPWTADNLRKLLSDSIYVNLHTAANSGGEIRGQALVSLHDGTVADLCGKQEVPAVAGNGLGAGYATIDPDKEIGYFAVVASGLTSNAAAAHIHKGAKGANGGVFINFGANVNSSNAYTGAFLWPTTTAADSLRDGLMYMNVHTTANSGGEIRGQLGKALTSDCLPTAIYELNGQLLEAVVYPNPTNEALNVKFQSNQSFDAQIVVSDLIGRSVIQKRIRVENGDNYQEINVSNMPSGVYFLQVKTEKQLIFTEKIVKE
jgi:Cu/Zn superoxide dismutase